MLLSSSVGARRSSSSRRRRRRSRRSARRTRLIVQTVTVKDKDGKPIEGLTAKDFVVTEDGEPQDIAFVEYQRLATDGAGAGRRRRRRRVAADRERRPPPRPTVAPAVQTQISTPPSGDIRYQDRRLLVLYFDRVAHAARRSDARVHQRAEVTSTRR